ncbi:MAG: ATP-grasp fold amidoligase family protein, partial [Pseudomonadota bacterium]
MPPLYDDNKSELSSARGLAVAFRRTVLADAIRIIFGAPFSLKFRYLYCTGRWPKVSRPERFTEKILHRLLCTNDPRFAPLSDKVTVRDYVSSRVGHDVLIPLLGVFEQITPADILALNERVLVLKNNHDCGSASIVDTDEDDLDAVCQRLNANTHKVYGRNFNEYWYQDIAPRIMAERFIGDEDRMPPADYRFNVFNQG